MSEPSIDELRRLEREATPWTEDENPCDEIWADRHPQDEALLLVMRNNWVRLLDRLEKAEAEHIAAFDHWHKESTELKAVISDLAPWASAALDDQQCCDELKAIFNRVVDVDFRVVQYAPFTCPECGGHYFGRDTAGTREKPEVLDTVRCHDEHQTGCKWQGVWPQP